MSFADASPHGWVAKRVAVNAGDIFEARAADFLQRSGLTLIARNWRCRLGEIDLIMRDTTARVDTLVFVEVRKRNSQQFGGAAVSISASKLNKLAAAISLYLSALPRAPACRVDAVVFDVVAGAPTPPEPTWIKNILQR